MERTPLNFGIAAADLKALIVQPGVIDAGDIEVTRNEFADSATSNFISYTLQFKGRFAGNADPPPIDYLPEGAGIAGDGSALTFPSDRELITAAERAMMDTSAKRDELADGILLHRAPERVGDVQRRRIGQRFRS